MAVCKHVIVACSCGLYVSYNLVEAQMTCSCSEIPDVAGSAMGGSGDAMLNVTGMFIIKLLLAMVLIYRNISV